MVFASEAKIKTMETRTDVRDAVRVLQNAISSSSSSASSSSSRKKKINAKRGEDDDGDDDAEREERLPNHSTAKHLAVQAVLNAAVPAREGTSFASSLKWSGKFSDAGDASSVSSSSNSILLRV